MQYLRAEPEVELPAYRGERPFRAIVVVEDQPSREWQWSTSQWLATSGCLYMLAWGHNCSSWDDSVDMANLHAFNFEEIPDHSSIVTTWHEDESLAEVFSFAKADARHPCVDIRSTLILHVSRTDRADEYAQLFAVA